MIRSLKILGLALVAMFALSALVASAASANPKLTPENESSYPVTLKGHEKEGVANELELEGGRSVKCGIATFEGTIANKVAAEESKLKATPVFENCTATILGNVDPATVTVHSCYLLLTADSTATGGPASEGWQVTGSSHLECATPGDKIEIHVYANATKHAENKPLCTYEIGPQTPTGSLDYKLNVPVGSNGTLGTIKSTITGVVTHRAAGTETNCGAENQTNGSLKGEAEVEGFESGGAMIKGHFED